MATGAAFRARFKYPYIVIHRVDLHNILLDAARRNDAIELIPEAMATSFEDRGDALHHIAARLWFGITPKVDGGAARGALMGWTTPPHITAS